MIPGISKPPVRGTPVEQPDPFTHSELPPHVLPALGTLVQLLPAAAFCGFVIAHPEDSWTVAWHRLDCLKDSAPKRFALHGRTWVYNGANSGIKMQIPVERKVICDL